MTAQEGKMDIQAYTQRGRGIIQSAQTEAVTRDHQQLTPLHIMSCLLYTSDAADD